MENRIKETMDNNGKKCSINLTLWTFAQPPILENLLEPATVAVPQILSPCTDT